MPESQEDKSMIIGRIIAGCTVTKKLGAGGMGSVFLAEHPKLGNVALKLMRTTPPPPQQLVKRFFREAQTLKQLKHQNIVNIYGFGKEEPFYFIAMEYIQGETIERILKRQGALKLKQAIYILKEVAQALVFAHSNNIVHRDIKPENIIVTPDNKVKVIDFGLVKIEGSNVTLTGQVMGTPMYMAPEQAEGSSADERTDIYALGAVGFYLLSGKEPYEGSKGLEILLKKIKNEPPLDLVKLNPNVPGALAQMIYRMMARFPEKRFKNMEVIRNILSGILQPKEEVLQSVQSSKEKSDAPKRTSESVVKSDAGYKSESFAKMNAALAASKDKGTTFARGREIQPEAKAEKISTASSEVKPEQQKKRKGCGIFALIIATFFTVLIFMI